MSKFLSQNQNVIVTNLNTITFKDQLKFTLKTISKVLISKQFFIKILFFPFKLIGLLLHAMFFETISVTLGNIFGNVVFFLINKPRSIFLKLIVLFLILWSMECALNAIHIIATNK